MKKYLLLIIYILLSFSVLAQKKLKGRVQDDQQQPLGFITVALLRLPDSVLINATLTNPENGAFELNGLSAGSGLLKITGVGWATQFVVINNTTQELGVLTLVKTVNTLKQVNVTGEKADQITTMEKKVFNVDKNLVSGAGSATDLLRNLPIANVDADGNISIRGSGQVTVLIDGKPSGMTGANRQAVLDQLPAAGIERIEFITNPGAAYDAEGVGGIINIILKKNMKQGANGNMALAAGSRDKYNANMQLNYRNKALNINTSYAFRTNPLYNYGGGYRISTLPDTTFALKQSDFGQTENYTHVARLAIDYTFNPKAFISFSWNYNARKTVLFDQMTYENFDQDSLFVQRFNRITDNTNQTYTNDLNVFYKQQFKKPGQELALAGFYSPSRTDNRSLYHQYDLPEGSSDTLLQSQVNLQQFNNAVLQADYAQPINQSNKIDAGIKTTNRFISGFNQFSVRDNATGIFTTDPLFLTNFNYAEWVYAAYGTYQHKWQKVTSTSGLRFENTNYTILQIESAERINRQYTNLFPSLFINWKASSKAEWQVSAARRINRPNPQNLNPVPDLSDPFTLRIGNPNLRPELITSFEFSHIHNWEKHGLTATLYLRNIQGTIQRIRSVDSLGISYVRFLNLNHATNTGIELIGRHDINKWWNFTTNFNAYYTVLSGNTSDGLITNNGYVYTAKLLSNFKIKRKTDVQVSSNYASPGILGQGRFFPFYGTDIAIKREIARNLSLVINWSDVFNQRRFKVRTTTAAFDAGFTRKRESRFVFATLTWRFGKELSGAPKKAPEIKTDTNQEGGF